MEREFVDRELEQKFENKSQLHRYLTERSKYHPFTLTRLV